MWITQLSDSSEQRQSAPTLFHNWTFNVRVLELTSWAPQLAQVRNMSIGEFWHSVRNIRNIRICMGKKPIVTVTYKNQRISMKNSLHKRCVTPLLCGPWADLWPFYGLYCKQFSLYIKFGNSSEAARPIHRRKTAVNSLHVTDDSSVFHSLFCFKIPLH